MAGKSSIENDNNLGKACQSPAYIPTKKQNGCQYSGLPENFAAKFTQSIVHRWSTHYLQHYLSH